MHIQTFVKHIVIVVFFGILSIYSLSGQCDNSSQWPDTAVNIVCEDNAISSSILPGAYSVTTGYQDQSTLVFNSSVASDYITLRKAVNNEVIASGTSPLMILYAAGHGDIEVHINTDAACGTSATTRASYVHMTCGCNNSVLFPAGNVTITEGMNIITTTQWAGDYNVTTGYIDGSVCTFSSSVSTDYITLRQSGSNAIIATGPSPVIIAYEAGWGDVEMHINTNDTCGTENINRTTTVSMFNPYKGGNDDGFVFGSFAQPDNPILAIFKGGNDDGFISACFAQPDNPILAIFQGGNDDGFVSSCFAQPDNPILAIFKGGNDDGFVSSCSAQTDNPILAIFKGGNDDGFVSSCFTQPDNPILTIFKGGNDDGFVSSCFAQPDGPVYAIYAGGNDDGFTSTGFTQADNPILAIFKGGTDDGFVSSCFAQADNPILAIFKGGTDDGFVSSCFAQADGPPFAIYNGGIHDGFISSCFAQADGPVFAIYNGGYDDGFVSYSFAQADGPVYAIYHGGIEDGFISPCFAQADGPVWAIYKGGHDDGFVSSCYEQCNANNMRWLGNVSLDWHTASNWECGFLPVITSDVVIPNGVLFFPTVSANVVIHSLSLNPGSSVNILPPAELRLKSF